MNSGEPLFLGRTTSGLDQNALGWVRSSQENFEKSVLKKNVIFPHIFLLILLNIGLYFYTVKIQIQY